MSQSKREKISIILPCYNEGAILKICHAKISEVIKPLPYDFEIIYVNDGSKDNSREVLKELAAEDPRIVCIHLSRNFGRETGLAAGIDYANGDALVMLDADMQDPPELVPEMIRMWKEEGADVVYGQRILREGETVMKKTTAWAFYKIIDFISDVSIPRNAADFRLMSRRVAESVKQLNERHRFLRGMVSWVGYKQVPLRYVRAPRIGGKTKYNYFKLIDFALVGITSYSITPLRIASFCGVMISLFAFLFGFYILFSTLLFGANFPGYASLMVMITFLSGIQLLSIGILGEYIGRIFGETKKRPLYFIDTIEKR